MTIDTTVLVAAISAGTALSVAAITYALNKRREREAEWRKLKLEHYKEYIAALSGAVGSRSDLSSQVRYSDSVNSMTLVAPPAVLRALYQFQDVIRYNNPAKTQDSHDQALSILLREIRRDVHPKAPSDNGILFRLMDVPPSEVDDPKEPASPNE